MRLGAAIRETRISRAISQKHLAEKIGLSQNQLCLIETGQSRPQEQTLKLICDSLEVSVELMYLIAIDERELPKIKRKAFSVLLKLMKELILMDA